MTFKQRRVWGAFFCGTAVILGAFGAHLLEAYISGDALQSYEVGVRYQFFHGLALLFLSLDKNPFAKRTAMLFVIGTLMFSCSIYGLSLHYSSIAWLSKVLGPITPIGGLLLILGWINMVIGYLRN
ncbi:MAG: DUF423 domain-containing protein [Bacteroidetes bacterium]|nr:DUF423 domain-containing protein [Bacteroidota bacterium]MDA0888731.1 DUF423 domain-containing protein [Bacteroidota bacterium]MDA1084270.1 DUF423 domain-containing protein [Bacteroidota bacterium]